MKFTAMSMYACVYTFGYYLFYRKEGNNHV